MESTASSEVGVTLAACRRGPRARRNLICFIRQILPSKTYRYAFDRAHGMSAASTTVNNLNGSSVDVPGERPLQQAAVIAAKAFGIVAALRPARSPQQPPSPVRNAMVFLSAHLT